MKDILIRSATGAVFVTFVIGSLWLGRWISFAAMALIGALGLYEFYTLKKHPLSGPTRWLSIVLGVLGFIGFALIEFGKLSSFFTLHIIMLPILSIFIIEIYRKKDHPLENTSLSAMGWIYILFPLYLLALLSKTQDFIYAIAPLLLTWVNDTFAYLGGRFLGKKSLFERISPKKTWEGSIIGISFALLLGAVLAHYTEKSLWFWLLIALVVAISSILGDLFESLFKRSLQIKDTGKLLPGHGGILDRMDATFFAVPLYYIILMTSIYLNYNV